MSVLVVGSFMTDVVARSKVNPLPGQTVVGNHFDIFLGGKGANQAIAAKRSKSNVFMVGALGNDTFGENFKNFFAQNGFDPNHILIKDTSSGVGHIVVNEVTGQNQIIIIPGANLLFTSNDLAKYNDLFTQASVVVNQLEMADEVIIESKRMTKSLDKLYLLNPAPFKPLSDEILNGIDFLTPNETELAGFVHNTNLETIKDVEQAAMMLINKGVKNVIVTLGDKGAMHCDRFGCNLHPAYKIDKAVDTTAAGDAFNGAFAACVDQGKSIKESIIYANAAGALAVTKKGAIPSIATQEQIIDFLNHQTNKY